MKNKKIFTIGLISLVVFTLIASYLWYVYFVDYERKLLSRNDNNIYSFANSVELVNSGGIDYVNATNKDEDNVIPIYYFRIQNKANKSFEYVLNFENVDVDDGCTKETTLSRDELEYVLKLDNKVVQEGDLSSISNNVLDINQIGPNAINDYSLKVKIKENVTGYEDKHFHYMVTIKENK